MIRLVLQEFCCGLISSKLVFKLICITILLYYTIHAQLAERMRKSFKGSERQVLYQSIGENTLSVECSDICHVLSNRFS